MKYLCKECQTEFSDEGEASFHSYEIHNMEFEDCIKVLEEESLVEDSAEEHPSEVDSMTEEELKNLARAKVAVDSYMESSLSETEEKMLLSRLMGQAGDKSVDKKAHDKVFPEKANTSNAFEKSYQHIIERLQDPQSTVCDLCGKEWEQIAQEEATILSDEKSKVGVPLTRIIHIKTKHVPIWNLIADLFGMPAQKIPDERVSTVPNPESVSATENPEKLSKLELAKAISESPELRKQFFRKWMLKLQEDKE